MNVESDRYNISLFTYSRPVMASSTSKELANSLSKNRGKEYKDQLRFISLIVKSFILRELESCRRRRNNKVKIFKYYF